MAFLGGILIFESAKKSVFQNKIAEVFHVDFHGTVNDTARRLCNLQRDDTKSTFILDWPRR